MLQAIFFFFVTGCSRSRGYRQSRTERETTTKRIKDIVSGMSQTITIFLQFCSFIFLLRHSDHRWTMRCICQLLQSCSSYIGVTKHRANPWQEREYQGAYKDEIYGQWYQDNRYMDAYKVITHPFCINVGVAIEGFNIDNTAASKALKDAKTRHAR